MPDLQNTKTPSEIDKLYSRSQSYQWLSDLFKHPNANPGFKPDDDVDPEEWAQQYEYCLGHTANSKVPAYELEYGEEHSHRQPQQLADIAAFYQAFGVRVNEKEHERVDHASVECEFMAFLCAKEAYALEHDSKEKAEVVQKAAREFLSNHLGSWLPAFTLRLSKSAPPGIMRNIANVTFDFVVRDCEELGLQPGSRDLPVRPVQEKEESGCVSCALGPGANGGSGANQKIPTC